tara:strand:- start:3037 stop:5091 length:2055 start_codon:yes stop_codon:yes gene_type:complete
MESMQQILPSGGLASFHNEVSRLADLGRYEDAYIVHAAEGETVVPMEVFDENPGLKEMLFAQMREMGIQPERYIVGNQFNSINPITGQPEFFLKQIFKEAKKALKKVSPYAGLIAGAAGLGPGYAALIGAGAPLLAGEEAGQVLMGGLSGYGAGKAFGTAKYAGGPSEGIFGSGDYIFGSDTPFKQLGANLGFGGADTAGGRIEQFRTAGFDLPEGTTLQDILANPELKNQIMEANQLGLLPSANAAVSSLSGSQIATLALFGVPIYEALKAEEEDKEGLTMEDITGKYPWYGQFKDTAAIDPVTGQPMGNPMGMANGGIIQHYQEGTGPFGVIYPEGDTDFDASDIINEPGEEDIQDLDLFMGDDIVTNRMADGEGIMMAMNQKEMITVYDKVSERVVTITRAEYLLNPNRYLTSVPLPTVETEGNVIPLPTVETEGDVIPLPTVETFGQYSPDIDNNMPITEGELPGAPLTGGQLEGLMNMRGKLDPRIRQLIDERNKMLEERQKIGEGITQMTDMLEGAGTAASAGMASGAKMVTGLAMEIAKAMKPTEIVGSDDIRRAMQVLAGGGINPEELSKILKIDIERAQEMLTSAQLELKDQAATENPMAFRAEGGIAHLAEGSFPRRTGQISGPGGPKDDRVPAMLSDGEFVMTAEAVRNAGGGSRREGAKKMYQLMNRLEGVA